MLEARNDVAKARLFSRTCSMCCAGESWSPSTSSTVVGPWCSTPPPLVLRAAVVGGVLGRVVAFVAGRVPCPGTPEVDPAASFTDVDDVGPMGTDETPCPIDSSCFLLFRGTSRKVSASSPSSASSSDQVKIACRRLLAGLSSGPPLGSLIFSTPPVSREVADLFFDCLGAAGRLPAARAAAFSLAPSTAQSTSSSSISTLV